MRTIESFEEYVDPVQQVIVEMFLPTLFGQAEPLPDELSKLVTLTPAQGGLGIPDLTTEATQQLAEKLKRDLRTLKAENTKSKIESIDASLNPELLRLTQQARDKGASSWLNAIPLKDQGLTLSKQEFRDSLRLRYNLPLQNIPSTVLVESHLT